MNIKGTKKKNQVVTANIFEQQELLKKAEVIKLSKRTIASTCSYDLFSAIIVSHDTESKKLST